MQAALLQVPNGRFGSVTSGKSCRRVFSIPKFRMAGGLPPQLPPVQIASSLRNPMPCVGSNDAVSIHRKVRRRACFSIQALVFVIRCAPENEAERRKPLVLQIQSCDHDLGYVANA